MAKEIRFAPSFVSSYRDYEAEAHEIVKKLIRASLERIAAEQSQQNAEQSTTEWPLGKDFTTESGLEAIDKFVKVNSRSIIADCPEPSHNNYLSEGLRGLHVLVIW